MLVRRTLIAIPALALLFSVIYFGGLYGEIIIVAAGVLCMHEVLNVTAVESKTLRIVGLTFVVLSFPAYKYAGEFTGVLFLFLLAVAAVLIVLVILDKKVKDGISTVFSMAYPGMFYIFLIAISSVDELYMERFLMIMAFGSAIVTDSFAYFTGVMIGKHKLAENISPKKTVEGAVGGAVFGIIAVYMIGYFGQGMLGISIAPWWYLVLGLALTLLAQVGDLAASKIKRKFGVKDYGKIMGVHGGAMDRLDSLLFVVPAVFAFYIIFLKDFIK